MINYLWVLLCVICEFALCVFLRASNLLSEPDVLTHELPNRSWKGFSFSCVSLCVHLPPQHRLMNGNPVLATRHASKINAHHISAWFYRPRCNKTLVWIHWYSLFFIFVLSFCNCFPIVDYLTVIHVCYLLLWPTSYYLLPWCIIHHYSFHSLYLFIL